MKKIICFLLLSSFLLVGCGSNKVEESKGDDNVKNSSSLVLYFSATGTTESVAKKIAEVTDSDIVEIIPEVAYTKEDLDYNLDCRANEEQSSVGARPKIKNDIDIASYDTIYLGYPIWWGTNPKIILTLLDKYDFKGKTVIPFCTSGSTGIEQSLNDLKEYNSSINWLEGKRFNASVSNDEIKNWINSLNIITSSSIYLTINDTVVEATLEDNSSAKALVEKLKENDLTLNLHDYGNFEKVGSLGFNLPTNDESITTTPGDIILYQGNQLTIYYDENTWDFTKLGKIDMSKSELKELLGSGDVTAKISLNK